MRGTYLFQAMLPRCCLRAYAAYVPGAQVEKVELPMMEPWKILDFIKSLGSLTVVIGGQALFNPHLKPQIIIYLSNLICRNLT